MGEAQQSLLLYRFANSYHWSEFDPDTVPKGRLKVAQDDSPGYTSRNQNSPVRDG
jgi:hypothetical protein